jgi:hypothetical protein
MASGTAASVKFYATGLQRLRVLTVKIELMSACDDGAKADVIFLSANVGYWGVKADEGRVCFVAKHTRHHSDNGEFCTSLDRPDGSEMLASPFVQIAIFYNIQAEHHLYAQVGCSSSCFE